MKNNITYSFEDWCIDNQRQDLLNRWDYDLNLITPSDISYKSNKKFWFKCPRGLHESKLQNVQYFASGKQTDMICDKCDSFAQYIIDTEGQDVLQYIWSDKNVDSPWDYKMKSNKKVWIKCKVNPEHEYEQKCIHYSNGHGCPYCTHQKVNHIDSLGFNYSKSVDLWSDKNSKTPFDYYPKSGIKVWWKCEHGKHEDYFRQIASATYKNFKCPKCIKESVSLKYRGENHHNWKGTTPYVKALRKSIEYKQWLKEVYNKDMYTCQCCGYRGRKLRAHHILNFSNHENIRFDVNNGITLCGNCHDVIIKNSFHNTYGTTNNTPEQLEEYINNRRKELGINIPFTIETYKNGNILKPAENIEVKESA